MIRFNKPPVFGNGVMRHIFQVSGNIHSISDLFNKYVISYEGFSKASFNDCTGFVNIHLFNHIFNFICHNEIEMKTIVHIFTKVQMRLPHIHKSANLYTMKWP